MYYLLPKGKLLVLLLIGTQLTGWGQYPLFQAFTTTEGLPSNEVYDAMEDEEGRLWFTTDRGIACFDSYTFQLFSTENGLAFNTNFQFFKEDSNTFWVNGFDGSLSFYDGRAFRPFAFNSTIQTQLSPGNWIEVLQADTAWLYLTVVQTQRFFAVHKKNGSIRPLPHNFPNLQRIPYLRNQNKNGTGFTFYYTPQSTSDERVLNLLLQGSDSLASSSKSWLKKVLNAHSHSPKRLLDLSMDNESRIWIGTDQGLCMQPLADTSRAKWVFHGTGISSILHDREGNTWLTTIGRGVRLIRSAHLEGIVRLEKYAIQQLEPQEHQLLFVAQPQELLALHHVDSLFSLSLTDLPSQNALQAIQANRIQQALSASRLPKRFHWTWQGKGLSIGSRSLKIFTDSLFNQSDTSIKINPRALLPDSTALWVGTRKGLLHCQTEEGSNKLKVVKQTLLGQRPYISDLCQSSRGRLFVGTLTQGIYYQSEAAFLRLQHPKLKGRFVNRLFLENDTTLWVASSEGLYRIGLQDTAPLRIDSVAIFSIENGFPDSYILDLCFWKDYLWVATNKGVVRFRPQQQRMQAPAPRLMLHHVVVGKDTLHPTADNYFELPHYQNDLRIHYTGITHHKPPKGQHSYRFRLAEGEAAYKAWSFTNERLVQWTNLKPGGYRFELQCQNFFGVWCPVKTVRFSIQPHYSQTTLFKVAMVVIAALLLIGLSYWSIRHIRRLATQGVLLQKAELAILKTQMNPHFIFNSLNAVQSYITKGKSAEAHRFLGNFAKLIRESLSFSRQRGISIQKEMDFLSNYLQLEQVRYRQSFSFQIDCHPAVDRHCLLPPMMVQPLAENAIKHALRELPNTGLLTIYFAPGPGADTVLIRVSDNGRGFPKTEFEQLFSATSQRSVGLKILTERLHYLNTFLRSSIAQLQWVPAKAPFGTSFELIVPKMPRHDTTRLHH
ncbi:MAG: histidine kinase [Salibacteraceae bacterium]